jgi:hypothetical protein
LPSNGACLCRLEWSPPFFILKVGINHTEATDEDSFGDTHSALQGFSIVKQPWQSHKIICPRQPRLRPMCVYFRWVLPFWQTALVVLDRYFHPDLDIWPRSVSHCSWLRRWEENQVSEITCRVKGRDNGNLPRARVHFDTF